MKTLFLFVCVTGVLAVTPPFWIKSEQLERNLLIESLDSTVRLKCPVGGDPKPTVRWLKDHISIENIVRPHGYPPFRTKRNQLVISKLLTWDEGNYTCIAENSEGSLSRTIRLETSTHLNHIPILIEKSHNITVMVGMPARLHCKFKSDLASVTHWVRPKSDPSSPDFDRNSPDSFRSVVIGNGSAIIGDELEIPVTKSSDAGIYFCVSRTNYGFTPGLLHLTVLDESEAVLEKPQNVTAMIGSTATFSCRTHLDLHRHTSWVRYVNDSVVELDHGTEVLIVDNVTEADAGPYACVVGVGDAHLDSLAYLGVINETEALGATSINAVVTSSALTGQMRIVAGAVSALMLLLIIIVAITYRRLVREKRKKRQAIANAHAVTQWTKKVIIERRLLSNGRGSGGEDDDDGSVASENQILAPIIRIEKQNSTVNSANRSRLGSEHTTLTTVSEYELPLDPEWEFSRSKLKLAQTLGEGAFGKVVKGEARDILRSNETTTVAVKMLKEGHTDAEMIDLVSEMAMMKIIGKHTNIINLLGVCTQDGPLYVIVEYAEHGNLKDFLRGYSGRYDSIDEGYERPIKKKVITERHLISFARQVCKGMEYLGSMKCIHRDLAARNVLVAKDWVIKIADFGLARDVHTNDYYKKLGDGRLPVKWMAPEALFERRYTTRSDVWSFGILLWEIMTMGANPYPSLPSIETLYELLRKGHRMERPPACSADIYMIMRQCWNFCPVERPSFSELIESFDRILTFARDNDYLDMGFNRSNGKVTHNNNNDNEDDRVRASPVRYSQLKTFLGHSYQNSAIPAPPPTTHMNPIYANHPLQYCDRLEYLCGRPEDVGFYDEHFASSAL